MIELSVNKLEKYFGATKVFGNISFDIKTGERVGLIGPNGCGKSTLLKMIMGLEGVDQGVISVRKGCSISYLNQLPEYDEDLTVEAVMTMAFDEILQMKKQMADLEGTFLNLENKALEKALERYGKLSEQFEVKGGYLIETNLNKISKGLKIDDEMRKKPFGLLSGGEKTRVELAKILLESPDILMLDEPSNHLDMTSIDWLEEFLKTYEGSVIIVSHDRYFLDRVAMKIYEMAFDRINTYLGNYSYYVVEKERRYLLDMKYFENQQKQINKMEEQIKRYRIWGAKRNSEDMYKRAKILERKLVKIERLDRPVFENNKVKFRLSDEGRSGKRVLSVNGLYKRFDDKLIFDMVEFEVFFGESVALLGDNGTGKTTLFKMIMEEWTSDNEENDIIKIGANVKLGYLPQEIVFNNTKQTILEYFQDRHNVTNNIARNELAKVLFVKDDVNKRIGTLSGGEKSRLKLCSLLFQGVNVLLLDEPTNHLDVDTREMLEEMLIAFKGTLLFISHDRYFITKLSNKILEIRAYSINTYNGGFNEYLHDRDKEVYIEVNTQNKSVVKKRDIVQNDRTQKKKKVNRYKLNALKEKIKSVEGKLEQMNEEMTVNQSNSIVLNELYVKQMEMEERLLDLYEELEAIEG